MGMMSSNFPKVADQPTKRAKASSSMKGAFGTPDQPEQSGGHTKVDEGHEAEPTKSLGERIAEGLQKRRASR